MKIISFNTNSIRTREHQLQALVAKHHPDIIGIQETKVTDVDFPLDMVRALGYHAVYHGQKTHYGVALLCKQTPVATQKGFSHDHDDAQRRFIQAEFIHNGRKLLVMNGYFPQGESRDNEIKFSAKRKFYADVLQHLQDNCSPDDAIILMGDMNVAPLDLDIGLGEDNARRWLKTGKCSFLPEEREWLAKITDWGMMDTFRLRQPDAGNRFSWFDYRSRGFENNPQHGLRIDLILASRTLSADLADAGIDYEIRGMEKPSDHCPVWAEFR
ncbi:MAG: exodeoxyribonuclease [Pseudomonadota bacterium]|nr:exodeoxyribonuclease [Pseudomonadota bacterium]